MGCWNHLPKTQKDQSTHPSASHPAMSPHSVGNKGQIPYCFYFSFHCFFFWSCKTNIYSLHKIVKIQEILFLWFSHSVMSNSLWPHELQHTMVPYPSPSPGAYSNSCPLSQWWHPTISSPVIPFSSCPQSFPASGFFPVSQLFASGGQSIGASIPASVLPKNIQGWFPLGLTGLISLLSKELSRVFYNTTVQKYSRWRRQHF